MRPLFALALSLLLIACGGRKLVPDCGDAGEYCISHEGQEVCCGGGFPYCGRAGSTCPPGYCCNIKPSDPSVAR